MNKKRMIMAVLALVMIIGAGVGATFAFLLTSSQPVINTFTVGNVQIQLSETTGSEYQLVPGTVVEKDPTLTVLAGSDTCWLFFRVEETSGIENFVIYAAEESWTPLAGIDGVYYRQVEANFEDVSFSLLKDNQFLVPYAVTEEQLAQLEQPHQLIFTGYAVQADGMETPEEAWQHLFDTGVADR